MGDQLMLLLMWGDQGVSGSGVGEVAEAAHCVDETVSGVGEGVVGGVGVGKMAAAAHCEGESGGAGVDGVGGVLGDTTASALVP